MRVLSWNLNGLRSVLRRNSIKNENEVPITFDECISHYDIICLQEIKISNIDQLPNGIFKKFKSKIYSVTPNSRSGVAILSKKVPSKVITDINIFPDEAKYHGRYIEAHFNKLIVICIYQPNSGDKLQNLEFRTQNWDPILLHRIQELQINKKNKIVINGDFNVINNPEGTYNYKSQRNKLAGVTDIEMKNFHRLLSDSKLTIANNKDHYTFYSNLFKARQFNKGMLIDFILKSNNLKVKNVKILGDIYGSDHLPISYEI